MFIEVNDFYRATQEDVVHQILGNLTCADPNLAEFHSSSLVIPEKKKGNQKMIFRLDVQRKETQSTG